MIFSLFATVHVLFGAIQCYIISRDTFHVIIRCKTRRYSFEQLDTRKDWIKWLRLSSFFCKNRSSVSFRDTRTTLSSSAYSIYRPGTRDFSKIKIYESSLSLFLSIERACRKLHKFSENDKKNLLNYELLFQ